VLQPNVIKPSRDLDQNLVRQLTAASVEQCRCATRAPLAIRAICTPPGLVGDKSFPTRRLATARAAGGPNAAPPLVPPPRARPNLEL
jgi:hypothetical protein